VTGATITAAPRNPAIDMLKGCAILWVLLIHSKALGDAAVYKYLVNQAVPIFIVLFGVNSELWWRRRSPVRAHLAEWYRNRFRRLVIPMWAALPVWWAIVFFWQPPDIRLRPMLLVRHVLGYMPEIGTSWFVTVIIQLVIVFPLLHVAARRIGSTVVCLLGLVSFVVAGLYAFNLFLRLGQYGYYIFAPRLLGHVAFGIWLAPFVVSLGWRAAAVAAVPIALCIMVDAGAFGGGRLTHFYARNLEPLPLTIVLLALMPPFARVPGAASVLGWLGQSSYGIYIGQMLTHNALVYHYGPPSPHGDLNPWLATLLLLAGGLAAVFIGEGLLRVLTAAGRGWTWRPSVAR